MIRFFNEFDIPKIYELGDKVSPNFSKTNDLEHILHDDLTKILVYEKENNIIGFLMYIELSYSIDIIDIYVEEEYRKQKIASCLLDYMITGITGPIKTITLEVRVSNTPAIHLYKKFDFQIVTTRKEYYDTEDAYLMERVLR